MNPVMYLNIPGGTVDAPFFCPPYACPCLGDPQCDGVIVNVVDVVWASDIAFRGAAARFDRDCPVAQTDVNCDGVTSVVDVIKIINVAFRGADPAVEFCVPSGL